MTSIRDRMQGIDWTRAVAGCALSCIASLSVHVLMLQVAHVPYPSGYPTSGWPIYCGLTLCAFAMLWFCQLATDRLAALPFRVCILFVAAVAAMLREATRVTILDGVVTTAWRYSFVSGLPRFFVPLFLACLCVPTSRYLRRLPARVAGALVIGGLACYAFLPALAYVLKHVLDSMSYLSHDEIYKVPYGWQVEIPAYITFLEPTVAAFLLAAFTLDRFSSKLSLSTFQFTLLVMSFNTSLIRPLLYLSFSPFPVPLALLSMSQFFFEWVILSFGIVLTWRLSSRRCLLAP